MGKFSLKSKISNILKGRAKHPLMEIVFLGTGGAFHTEEKNSSMLLQSSFGNILVDCGSTVYTELKRISVIKNINYVFITHCHDDHIGSLSTLIFDRWYLHQMSTKIQCHDSLKESLENYLMKICGHNKDQFSINENSQSVFEDLNMNIFKIDTTGYHVPNQGDDKVHSAGFVFNFKKNGEDIFIIFSGDIRVPIIDIIKSHESLWNCLIEVPDNVFIFHDATAYDFGDNGVHCFYEHLFPTLKTFINIFTYHHSKEETKIIVENSNLISLTLSAKDLVLEESLGV